MIRHPLANGIPPAWVDAWGQDEYGGWVAIELDNVSQLLRWVPPGEFLMGSPESEQGRYEREIQHQVTLQGFWLFDTPVTQALWHAVMGENPSRFQASTSSATGLTRPVENVSWNDAQEFIAKLNTALPGLELCLPSEAQWEYACRAGTKTATYAVDLEILGKRNAPLLDKIAWYGGNSGVDFELENGYDVSSWKEKQYENKWAGTHPVGLKQPNSLGLYDMLGNVWEWCEDYWSDTYPAEAQTDPTGLASGSSRVIRGGSWSGIVRFVRAAYRRRDEPGNRLDSQGFRCARVQA